MKKIVLMTISAVSLLLSAQQPYEVGLTIGGTKPQSDLKLDDHKNYGIRFGMDNNLILENMFDKIEFIYERSNDVDYENTTLETNINRYSINMLHNYNHFKNIIPYGMIGLGYEDFSKEYLKVNDSVTANLGVGLKFLLNDVVSLRAEVRDQINLEHSVEHELIYTVGLGFAFGESSVKEPIVEEKPIVEKVIKKEVEKEKIVLLDSDGDGVYDKDDKCPNTLKGFSVDTYGCPLDYNLGVNFDTDKYIIKDQYNDRLYKFVEFMNMMPHYKAEINGHTDSIGSEQYNQTLSEKRAQAVMQKLIEIGLDRARLTYKGYGETQPLSTNDTKEGREQNRRVEATIIK